MTTLCGTSPAQLDTLTRIASKSEGTEITITIDFRGATRTYTVDQLGVTTFVHDSRLGIILSTPKEA